MLLTDRVNAIKGVGDKSAVLLKKLDINTVYDLITHFPRDYEVFSMPEQIADIREGETAAIEGVVSRLTAKAGRRHIVSCYCSDPSGAIRLVWFNQPYITKQLKPGTRYLFRGIVKSNAAEYFIQQPKMYERNEYRALMSTLQPRYDLTKGITHNFILKAARSVLENVEFEERLSAKFRKENQLVKYADALRGIHFPDSTEEALQARRRLVFDEFVDFFTALHALKEGHTEEKNGYLIKDFGVCDRLISDLPFNLTGAQLRVVEDIKMDMSSERLMCRMLEGDVGSGKTIMAMLAMLAVVNSGYQAALMVPTEVLAGQHYKEFCERLMDYNVRCCLLVGSMTASEKKRIYAKIKAGEYDIIIGTHALIQEKLDFSSLGLAVIDEQHRFGVRQREMLKNKGLKPHILCMSATPIPRSLSLILYGDMDLSVIDEMPAERLPIKNCIIDSASRMTAVNFLRKEVAAGHQAYCICPMVEESETMDGENVMDYCDSLTEALDYIEKTDSKLKLNRKIVVEYLHGKMTPSVKNEIMERFSSGLIDILVSTTVVEVGVNVKNATVMLIENSERFGLAQLHQLRGRVGRGRWQSYCIFVKGRSGKEIDERLNILRDNNNGFKVAEEDLRLRGPGDLFGIRQAGELSWKLADIYTDASVLALAREYCHETLQI